MRLLQRIVRQTVQNRALAGGNALHRNRETSYEAFVRLQENFEKLKQDDSIDSNLKGTLHPFNF